MAQTELATASVAAVFRMHHDHLVRLAVLFVGDQPSAEDVVQDVYLSVLARWSKHRGPDEVLPYVRAAVVNGCRSVLRHRARGLKLGMLQRGAAAEPPLPSAEHEAMLSEDRRQVLAALATLSRRRREVLVLRYYLGLSEAEIAAVLGVSAGTVKSTAARGLAALARELGEEA
jgi:RNA polymerase sigma-70 factor (sigma-E family)